MHLLYDDDNNKKTNQLNYFLPDSDFNECLCANCNSFRKFLSFVITNYQYKMIYMKEAYNATSLLRGASKTLITRIILKKKTKLLYEKLIYWKLWKVGIR
jgi:hypothetical protein